MEVFGGDGRGWMGEEREGRGEVREVGTIFVVVVVERGEAEGEEERREEEGEGLDVGMEADVEFRSKDERR